MAMVLLLIAAVRSEAACTPCNSYQPGISWGFTAINALSEASGLAASARNPGVLWTHNDGSRKRVYAVSTNGATLSSFNFTLDLGDVEDMAVGPGPVAGTSYLYYGDIGGNASPGDIRSSVVVLRVPEPLVDLAWAGSPREITFAGVQSFTLTYPDGSFDAETLLVDPITADVLVVTKQDASARLYRANLNTAANTATVPMTFVRTVAFAKAAGGDISADGKLITLRREEAASLWARCDDDSISTSLGRTPKSIPVIGKPTESNGEAIAFLRDGSGYVTISECDDQPIYFFRSTCAQPPLVQIEPIGAMVRISFEAIAGLRYGLEAKADLLSGSWTATGDSVVASADGLLHFDTVRTVTRRFFRVVVQ